MRTIPIELAYALCLVSPWMHNRSVTRAGATSSYKLQLVADGSGLLVVAILWALMLEIGTSVTTADVHPEVLVDDLLHRQAEEVELPIIMVEDVRGQFIVAQLAGLVAHIGSTHLPREARAEVSKRCWGGREWQGCNSLAAAQTS